MPRTGLGCLGGRGGARPSIQNIHESIPNLCTNASVLSMGNKSDAIDALEKIQGMKGFESPVGGLPYMGQGVMPYMDQSAIPYAKGGGAESCCSSCFCKAGTLGYLQNFKNPFCESKLFTNMGKMCAELLRGTGSANMGQADLKPLRQLRPSITGMGCFGGMAKGGVPAKYMEAAPKGHNPEFITGHTGYYAHGRGTGQSDDIPAMLHDGDYVMDAESVSALGDGSSLAGKRVLDGFRGKIPHRDAAGGNVVPAKIADGEYVFPAAFVTALGKGDNKRGAEILDGLREKLREHKRSAPLDKIPPKAKSPLSYIKKGK